MIDAIKFTRGAVAKKDYVPELTHFRIENGHIIGFNGILALSSPIPLDLNVRPKADTFAKAVHACEETIAIHMTPAGRLSINSGKFRALVDCLPDDLTPIPVAPEGWDVDLGEEFIEAIRAVSPFQGFDASRPWAMGIMLKGRSAYATNNICFVEYWHGHEMPFPVNLPKVTVNELLRINQVPSRVTATEHSMTFHYADGRWMRSALLGDNWPAQAFTLLERRFNYQPVPNGMFDALAKLKPFLGEGSRVYFQDGFITTGSHGEEGASFEVDGLEAGPVFNHGMLSLLDNVSHVDFSTHPQPCGFYSGKMRGMILGLNL